MLPNVQRPNHSAHGPATGEHDVCPTPAVMANLSGLWKGTLFRAGDDAETPFSLHQEKARSEGAVVGRLAFNGSPAASANVQLLEASATTYVALVGPYYDPTSNVEMVTVLEGRTTGDRLYGTYSVRPLSGGRAAEGRFVAVRSSARAA